jgi:hypothetical protein
MGPPVALEGTSHLPSPGAWAAQCICLARIPVNLRAAGRRTARPAGARHGTAPEILAPAPAHVIDARAARPVPTPPHVPPSTLAAALSRLP